MNFQAIKAIYIFEMSRTIRTLIQSIASPVISTVLYFIVFGSAIGSRMQNISDVSYGSFIVPGLILLTVCLQSISNASFGIYFPKFLGTINELLSAPVSYVEIVIGYVSAAVTKSMVIGLIILITASFLVDLRIEHPVWMIAILFLSCVSFSLLGFIIGIWAKSFEQITIVPDLIITPLVFLGGSFYSITLLPEFWQKVTLFNPVVYLISGFRWSFFGNADVSIGYSITAILLFTTICILIIWRIFWTGYRIKS
ncbi:MAG: ABC transporter permease [Alphaproteobacteria bacterium]|uniref:Transport permease protein n=1 Tax=PS1 clade bacterium TaxID=2175152 RepID=A0A368DLR3_9PROT|nr:sugar ABC transporter permease [Rhodobiaceae bacterium]OUT73787.1 MAG: sugar ABC transporter permease [Rhizobiales bacterium TMED25]RCL72276.1 MAG: ABC transporter permease [PS1 clade bacterium]|tara:strand:+ start:12176 stop:12937 length:762 start_codon:yes stop_codon:yes gene_type:complete